MHSNIFTAQRGKKNVKDTINRQARILRLLLKEKNWILNKAQTFQVVHQNLNAYCANAFITHFNIVLQSRLSVTFPTIVSES